MQDIHSDVQLLAELLVAVITLLTFTVKKVQELSRTQWIRIPRKPWLRIRRQKMRQS